MMDTQKVVLVCFILSDTKNKMRKATKKMHETIHETLNMYSIIRFGESIMKLLLIDIFPQKLKKKHTIETKKLKIDTNKNRLLLSITPFPLYVYQYQS